MAEADNSGDQRAIRAVYRSWFAAMEDGDVDGFLGLLSDDVILKMPGSSPVMGREAVRDRLRAFHDAYTEEVDHRIEEIDVSGDLAFARVSEVAQIRARSEGHVTRVSGMHLAILRRQPGDVWLVARDVSSLDSGS